MTIVMAMLAVILTVGIVIYLGPLAILLSTAGIGYALYKGWRFSITVNQPRRNE